MALMDTLRAENEALPDRAAALKASWPGSPTRFTEAPVRGGGGPPQEAGRAPS